MDRAAMGSPDRGDALVWALDRISRIIVLRTRA
jgi:phage terminase large subunit-like protein